MKSVTIYTGPLCNFCEAAKRLLARNNAEYKEINIATAKALKKEFNDRYIGILYGGFIATKNGVKLIEYNAKIAADNKREEATFAIIKGQIARNQATLAQLGTIATTGSSLLTMNQGSKTA